MVGMAAITQALFYHSVIKTGYKERAYGAVAKLTAALLDKPEKGYTIDKKNVTIQV